MKNRYVIVVNSFNLGGAEQLAFFLARNLRTDFGLNVEVWGFRPINRLFDMCTEQGIPVRALPKVPIRYTTTALLGAAIFAQYIHHYGASVLLPYTIKPNLICGLSWRLGGADICIWNQLDEGKWFKGRAIERWALQRVKHYAANSPASAEALQRQGVSKGQIRMIYNGIELPPPRANRIAWRQKLGIDPDCFTACMVATLSRYKDHATLLRAWRKFVDGSTDKPILLLAGRAYDAAEELLSLTKQLNLEPFVRFLGEVDDISGLLQAVDLGLFSSLSEGMPSAVLEYMAAGLPILSSDLPGTRIILGEAAATCTFPSGDPSALAEGIRLFLAQQESRRVLAGDLQIRAAKYFTPQHMAEQYLEYIKEIQSSSNSNIIK